MNGVATDKSRMTQRKCIRARRPKIINRAPLDEEQQSALCLYAQALADRPARLMLGEREFVGLGA